ncbi:MAG: hypothetical protein ACNA8L_01520 [Luteolibacter sp.]
MIVMLGCVGLMGGYTWLKNERANRPDRIWVPIPLNTELSHEKHLEFADKLRDRLASDEILGNISHELKLLSRGNFATEEAAVTDLRMRLICEVGEYNYAPSLNVGFRGKRRENALLRELTERLMQDFQAIVNRPHSLSDTP